MMRRLLRSRGARKLRRSRAAMLSLGIISLYFVLGLFVVVTEAAGWIGRKTGSFSMDDRPILGILLASRTAQEVGPPHLSGFGMRSPPARHARQLEHMIDKARAAIAQAEEARAQLDAGRGLGTSPEQIITATGYAERTLAPLPPEQLRALVDQARERWNELVAAEGALGSLGRARAMTTQAAPRLAAGADRLDDIRRRQEAGEDDPALDERADIAREEIAFTLLDLSDELTRFAQQARALGVGEEAQPLTRRADRIAELADSIESDDGAPAAIAAAREDLAALRDELRDARAHVEPLVDAARDRVAALTDRLFPRPAGLAGAIHAFKTAAGTDRQGRSILVRSLYSARIAIQVGMVVAVIAVLLGSLLGAAAAYFGGWVDHVIMWLYSIFSAIPSLVLLTVLAFMFRSSDYALPWDSDVKVADTLIPLYAAFSLTFWIGPCRVIRGEAMKLKELEYIQAATAVGFGRFYILLRHLIPNTTHLMFINLSLLFIGAVKGEVILTFLGLGLKSGASWGLMIQQSASEVANDYFWQIGTATAFMFLLVLAFNVLTDALQDAFDPRHVS